jgi:hypothetical protein
MESQSGNEKTLVFSYLTLRKVIGILGIVLPFVVSLGALILFKTGLQSSVSSYYYTGMRDVFVGTLFATGFFLLSYKGYELSDDIAGDLACIFAVGAAIFPTAPDSTAAIGARIIGYIHLAFAALFFSTLTYFSLFLFTKTNPNKPPTRRKLQRNKVYKVCGYTMVTCILLMAIYSFLPGEVASFLKQYKPVYWLEALAILAFGISWFTKGETILKDEVELPG